MSAHAEGEADEFVGQGALGLIAFEAQAGEPGLRALDFLPDLFGLARFLLKFIDGCAAELGGGGKVMPSADEIPCARKDVVVAKLFHERESDENPFIAGDDAFARWRQANTETQKV